MRALFLPGNSKESNDLWIYHLAEKLLPLFDDVGVIRYKHWDNGETNINLSAEVAAVAHYKSGKDNVVFIAKSAGVLVALELMKQKGIVPVRSIFIGIPIGFAEKLHVDLRSLLSMISTPTLIIQKEMDPAGNARDIQALFANPCITFQQLSGDTHDYSVAELCELDVITNFIL